MMINSKNYWDKRFHTRDWDEKGGKEQTLFFSKLLIDNLPDWFIGEVNRKGKMVCDWGCAEGQGVYLFSKVFYKAEVVGVDISEEAIKIAKKLYPSLSFFSLDIEHLNDYDVIISSNTLEHFFHPWEIAKRLAVHSSRYLVFLVPFQEKQKIDEHFYTFEYSNIPFSINGFGLKFFRELYTKDMPNTYWFGKQMLLIYEKGYRIDKSFLSDLGVDYLSDKIGCLVNDLDKANLMKTNAEKEKENVIVRFDYLNLEYYRVKKEKEEILNQLNQTVSQLNKTISEKSDLQNQINQTAKEKEEILNQLNQTVSQLNKTISEKSDLQNQINQIAKEKERLARRCSQLSLEFEQVASERDSVKLQLNQMAEEKERIVKEFENILYERNNFFNQLDQIYSSDFWKVATFYYRLKERSPVLKGVVSVARRVKRLALSKRENRIEDVSNVSEVSQNSNGSEQFDAKQPEETYVSDSKDFLEYYKKLNLPNDKSKFDIIFFSIIDWNFRIQRPQHIASRLAGMGHRVFYLKVSFSTSKGYDINKVRDNVYEVRLNYPSNEPIYNNDLSEGIDVILKSVSEMLAKYSVKEFVCFVEFPMWYNLVSNLRNKYGCPVIFDVLDEFSGFDNVHKDIESYEEKMFALSDAVIASSNSLCEKVKKIREDCHLVRNGADYEHFNVIKKNDILKGINAKRPIIGYYGAISSWFDSDIVEYAAKEHPEWSFVLIGSTFGADVRELEKLKNVYLLGEKPYAELPKYLYWFDVCLIPFKDIPLIKSTNPVKFYEYLSAGKPVVATDMDELREFSDLAYISKTKEDFVKNIELALQESDDAVISKRKEVAKNNSWDSRVKVINSVMEKAFPKVSIIVVTYNNLDYTKLCLNSIVEKTAYPNYEIIVVDNNSSDGTKNYLKSIKDRRVVTIFNEDNLGFAKANNIGIRKAEGDYIILLNNDTVVTRGWVNGLLKHFDDSVGMVGPVTNSIGNEAKINVDYESLDEMDAFAEYYTFKHFGESFEIKVLAMFCVAIKRKVIDKVGLLDERYGVGMFEDDDYAMAVKRSGYRLLCAEDVFIHHFGSATFKGLLKDEMYRKLFEENRKKFENKWKVKWEPHKYRDGVN